jgi:hypothetical protein
MSDSSTRQRPLRRSTSLMSLSKHDVVRLIKSVSFESIRIPQYCATDDTATFIRCVCNELAECLAANSPGKSPQKLLESRKLADNNSDDEDLMDTPTKPKFPSVDLSTTDHRLSRIRKSPPLEISKQFGAMETPEGKQEDPRRKLVDQLDLCISPFHPQPLINADRIHPTPPLKIPLFDEPVDMDKFASTEGHKKILKERSSFLLDQLDIDPFVSIWLGKDPSGHQSHLTEVS